MGIRRVFRRGKLAFGFGLGSGLMPYRSPFWGWIVPGRRINGGCSPDKTQLGLLKGLGFGDAPGFSQFVKVLHEQAGTLIRHGPEGGKDRLGPLVLGQHPKAFDLPAVGVLAAAHGRVAGIYSWPGVSKNSPY